MNEKTKGILSVLELQEALEDHIRAMEAMINDTMEDKGDTPDTCQRRHLLNQLMLVDQAVNGISPEDMKNDAERE